MSFKLNLYIYIVVRHHKFSPIPLVVWYVYVRMCKCVKFLFSPSFIAATAAAAAAAAAAVVVIIILSSLQLRLTQAVSHPRKPTTEH